MLPMCTCSCMHVVRLLFTLVELKFGVPISSVPEDYELHNVAGPVALPT